MSTPNWPNVIGTPANADNAIASITLSAQGAGKRLEAVKIIVGYDAKPSTAKLVTLKRGSTKIAEFPITEAGPAPIDATGFMTGPNEAMTVELAASGTAGIKGYVNIAARVI